MTINKPVQIQSYKHFLILLFSLILMGGIFYIYYYNILVDTRYQLKALKTKINETEIANIDAKNSLYQIIHPTRLEVLAQQYNLTLERAPEYLTSAKWVSDSSY